MKIEQSGMNLAGQHAASRQHRVEESLRTWVGAPPAAARTASVPAATTTVTLSSAASSEAKAEPREDGLGKDVRMQVLIRLIEALTGRRVRVFDAGEIKQGEAAAPPSLASPASTNALAGWSIEYQRREVVHESEITRFSASGVVRTADGRELRFELALEMKREFHQESTLALRAGDAVQKQDPLVINFNGQAAQLGEQRFSFDLDADGTAEQITFVVSGFLALDRNGNGVIDDGSELFGTQSGNGFADLAAYDSDGNQWIDEGDPVYAALRIWGKDAAGKDRLESLAQRNVGALYLGSVATPFDLKEGANTLMGQVRQSGVWFGEDGSTGTLQQVDLVV